MNKSIITIAFILQFSNNLLAQKYQKPIGLYITADDFLANNLSYKNQRDSKTNTIKLNQIFNGKYIQVLNNNQKKEFSKDSVYGYCMANGTKVRFVHKDEYKFMYQSDSFCIYRGTLPRIVAGRINVTPYYYSTSPNGVIKKLTIANLKLEYKNDNVFCKKNR